MWMEIRSETVLKCDRDRLHFKTNENVLVCVACEQESERDSETESERARGAAKKREGQASTRKPLYGNLNTEGHLPNITSLFSGEKNKTKKKKTFFFLIVTPTKYSFHMSKYNMTANQSRSW